MKHLLLFLFVAITCSQPVLADLPTAYSSPKVTGRIDNIGSMSVWGKKCSVIHLRAAEGFERQTAKTLFRIIRRSGYKPKRKSLRGDEIVLVLPESRIKKLKVGDDLQIIKYLIAAHDNRTLATEGEAKEVAKQ